MELQNNNNETKKIYFESASLFQELVKGKQIGDLKSVKSNPYPTYCFKATKRVMNIVSEFMVNHDMKHDRTVDDAEMWKEFEKVVVNAGDKVDTIVTRNLRAVKRIVAEGYGYMLKRTCVDQYKKKAFVFYANDRIAEIKAEEDMLSKERFEKKLADTEPSEKMEVSKKKVDTEMSRLIKKAMGGTK